MRLSLILLSVIFISCSDISHNSAEWQIETYIQQNGKLKLILLPHPHTSEILPP